MKKSDARLIADAEYLPALLKLLASARASIDILAFSFAIGSAGGKIAFKSAPYLIAQKLADLKEKYGRALKIRLYIEGERETADRNRVTAEFLKKAGVQVRYGATHAKGFLVDGRKVLFGSTNLTEQSVRKNNETNLLLSDPAAARGFEAYFEHLWRGGRHGGITLDPPLIADGGFEPALLEMIDAAKRTLEFSIYFFQHGDFERALIRAHRRGVHVRGFVHDHRVFALSYVRRTHATIRRLREAGITDLHFGPNYLFTHSKYLIRDRAEIALGTGNWLHEDVEIHPQLYIRFQRPALARELARNLESKIQEVID